MFYDEEDFPSFEKQLFTELVEDDRSNIDLLGDFIAENDLPPDPIRIVVTSFTDQQNTDYDAVILQVGLTVPTKLQVLENPACAEVVTYSVFIKINNAVTAAKKNIYKTVINLYLRQEMYIYKIVM